MTSRIAGIDCGTMFFQTAEVGEGGEIQLKEIRNAFVELEASEDIEQVLEQNNWQYVSDGKHYYVIGEDSMRVARMFPGRVELRRPMQNGVLNKGEDKKMLVMAKMIESSIGKAPDDTSLVCTCVSSDPVDGAADNTFHKARLEGMFKRLGWNIKVIEEGHAVVLSENPVIVEADGKTVPFSGIGVSCLCPGTKVYTKRGIINIEDVETGDEVITHKGRWKKVEDVIVTNFTGDMTKIQIGGYSNNTEEYKFVKNHELHVYRDNQWEWIGCDDLKEKDIVGEPILRRDKSFPKVYLHIRERITSSNKYNKKQIESCADVQRLLGYFLGDGSIMNGDDGIVFDFGPHEINYANDVVDILKKNFKKYSSYKILEYEGYKKLRVYCSSRGMASFFRNHFYDKNKEKTYPYDITRLSKGECLNLLVGMIRSDGWTTDDQCIAFSNTSTSLILLGKQLLSRIGYAASINWRTPRNSLLKETGREINGKKNEWSIVAAGKKVFNSLDYFINNIDCSNSIISENMFLLDNFCCSFVQKIEKQNYQGKVYDLKVEDDHSFSGPFLTIHNCGAGKVNCVLAYRGLPIVGMSAARSGDWIDSKVAEHTDKPISQVTNIKETKLDFNNIDYDDDVLFALDAYYGNMIEYVFKNFAKKFSKVKSEFEAPLDIVIAGGTSKPKGFRDKVEAIVKTLDLPFKINNIVQSKDPRNAVVKGCLTQAIIFQKKLKNKAIDKALD